MEQRTVLVVEDDPDLQELVWFNLRLAGLQVVAVSDGEAALRAVAEHRPDAVVLDVMMPNLDGIAVLRALRADPATVDLPVVVVTARATDTDIWDGWQAGADHYLTKPVRIAALVELITELVGAAKVPAALPGTPR
jgi:DNA-binding response OmpR family regulator